MSSHSDDLDACTSLANQVIGLRNQLRHLGWNSHSSQADDVRRRMIALSSQMDDLGCPPVPIRDPSAGVPSGDIDNQITTNRNDSARTGQYVEPDLANFDQLSPALPAFTFGHLFTLPVKGAVYAQPLILNGTATGRPQDVVVIATDKNQLYLFTEDSNASSAPLWKHDFGPWLPSGALMGSPRPIPSGTQTFGIIGTPVFANHRLYLVADTFDVQSRQTTHTLHAVDLAAERVAQSQVIDGDALGPKGGRVQFRSTHQVQRPGLLYHGGVLYVAFGAPYYGWVFAYDAETFARLGVFCTTSRNAINGGNSPAGALEPVAGAGIWQSGCGLTVDANGYVYAMTGNGSTQPGSYGNSFLRLRLNANVTDPDQRLHVDQFYRPPENLNAKDQDLGSAGPILSVVPRGTLIIGGGKSGKLYAFDTARMTVPLDTTQIGAPGQGDVIISTPAYWSERNWMYVFEHGGHLHRFELNPGTGHYVTTAARSASGAIGWYGQLSIAKRGGEAGVIWCTGTEPNPAGGKGDDAPGWLRAYDAATLAVQEWPIGKLPGPPQRPVRFTPPTPANSKVYVGAEDGVHVFGFQQQFGFRAR
jgi:hypothetical protein